MYVGLFGQIVFIAPGNEHVLAAGLAEFFHDIPAQKTAAARNNNFLRIIESHR